MSDAGGLRGMDRGELVVLTTDRDELRKCANEVLDEGKAFGFESVCVVGVKEGTVYFHKSRNVDTVKLLGMIEVAKQEIWDKWK